ncbi:MAG: hypothetical protein V4481_02255 [Patescibacteria group bacterium]
MKNNMSFIKKVAVIAGLTLGAFSLSAIADWTAPLSAPPTCVTGNPGCDAPINASATGQGKMGKLGLGSITAPTGPELLKVLGGVVADTLVTRTLAVTDGVASSSVLTSDASGNAKWQPIPTPAAASCSNYGVSITDGVVVHNTTGNPLMVVAYSSNPSGITSQVILEGYIGSTNSVSNHIASSKINNGISGNVVTANISFMVPVNFYYKVLNAVNMSFSGTAMEICR